MSKYVFIKDASHGWLRVDRKELKELGIEKQISKYSYELADEVYLEEDCDMGLFVKAKGLKEQDIKVIYDGPNCPVRSFNQYCAF